MCCRWLTKVERQLFHQSQDGCPIKDKDVILDGGVVGNPQGFCAQVDHVLRGSRRIQILQIHDASFHLGLSEMTRRKPIKLPVLVGRRCRVGMRSWSTRPIGRKICFTRSMVTVFSKGYSVSSSSEKKSGLISPLWIFSLNSLKCSCNLANFCSSSVTSTLSSFSSMISVTGPSIP